MVKNKEQFKWKFHRISLLAFCFGCSIVFKQVKYDNVLITHLLLPAICRSTCTRDIQS